MKLLRIIAIVTISALILLSSCNGNEETHDTSNQTLTEFEETFSFQGKLVSLEEAGKLIGAKVPVPGYLPERYTVQEVYVSVGNDTVKLLIADGPIEKMTKEPQNGPKDYLIHSVKCEMSISLSFEKDLRAVGGDSEPVMIPITITPLDFFASKEGGYQVDWSVETDDGIVSLRMQSTDDVADENTLKIIAESIK